MRLFSCAALSVVVVSWAALGCGEGTPAAAAKQQERLPLDSVYRSARSGLTQPTQIVVRDSVAWQIWWRRVTANYVTLRPPPLPSIDFSEYMVILVGSGTHPVNQFAVSVDSAIVIRTKLWVYLTDRGPGPGCVAGMSSTQPVHAVRAPRRPETPEFLIRKLRSVCE